MKRLPKALHYSLLLVILGAIVGALLSLVNRHTAPIIEDYKLKIIQPMLEEFAPDAKAFEIVTDDYQNRQTNIKNIYVAYVDEEKTEQQALIIYVVTSNQYGDIDTLIAIDIQTNTFIDIKFVASTQTKGIGDVDLLNSINFNLAGRTIEENIDGYALASAIYTTASIAEAVDIATDFYNTVFEKLTQTDPLLETIQVKMPTAATYESIKSQLTVENDHFIGIHIYEAKRQSRNIGDKNTLNGYYQDFGNVGLDESIDTISQAIESTSAVKEVVDLASAHYQANSEFIKGLEG